MAIKQKIVLQVDMHCDKCRKKAMEIAAVTEGVTSIATEGAERNRLVLVGLGIDTATLTTSLRKKVGHTSIISVKEVKENDGEDEEDENKGGSYSENNSYTPYPSHPPLPPCPGYAIFPYDTSNFPNTWFKW